MALPHPLRECGSRAQGGPAFVAQGSRHRLSGSGGRRQMKRLLAAFAGAMIDEGAGGLDSKAFHEALANRAISFSARAERDYLVISISTLKENAPEAMHLLQLALTRPRFENEAL